MLEEVDKIKLKVTWLPINAKGELILDYKQAQSLTLSLFMRLRTLWTKDRIKSDGYIESKTMFKVNGTQVVWPQQWVVANVAGWGGDSDGIARGGVNTILWILRTHGLIDT